MIASLTMLMSIVDEQSCLQGRTPLHCAVWTSIKRVSILLQQGAKVNAKDAKVRHLQPSCHDAPQYIQSLNAHMHMAAARCTFRAGRTADKLLCATR